MPVAMYGIFPYKLGTSITFGHKYMHYKGIWEARLAGTARARRTASKVMHRRNRAQASEANNQARAEAESRSFIQELGRIFTAL